MNKGNLSFGFSAIVAGQKSSVINAAPQLIVSSTSGKFNITPAVSSAMGLASGDYIQFADNINEIEAAIRNQAPELVAVADEMGVDLNTREGAAAIIAEFRTLGIFKGVAMLNADGTPKMANARTTKTEKQEYLAANPEVREQIVAALTEKGIEVSEDNILNAMGSKQEPAYTGSKLASTSEMTGVGLSLNFTDSNVWNILKSDVEAETRESVKKIYTVDVKNTIKMPYNNGQSDIEVEVFPLTESTIETVAPRKK